MIFPQQYKFENHQFTPTVHKFDFQDGEDFVKALQERGWTFLAHLPHHENWEFGVFTTEIFYADDGRFYVEMLIRDIPVIEFFCTTAIDLLALLRDWICPLVVHSHHDVLSDMAQKAQEVLFDRETGLGCAQRYGDRERRWREARRQEKAKA